MQHSDWAGIERRHTNIKKCERKEISKSGKYCDAIPDFKCILQFSLVIAIIPDSKYKFHAAGMILFIPQKSL
jgi:hypothetical protein